MPGTETAHKTASPEEWLQARRALLEQEKLLTRLRAELAQKRRDLPWVKVETNYTFDAPQGKVTLADLFAGRSQLIVYHFMFGPDWDAGCPSCSLITDSMEGGRVHINQRDVTLVLVSRAPIEKIETFKKRMGWKTPWVSSNANRFNFDYHVSFTEQEIERGDMFYNFHVEKFPSSEAPGASVFFKDTDGTIYHTYSTYGRGLESLMVNYDLMDITPKGRDEDALPHPMAWVRHHDLYPQSQMVAVAPATAKEKA
jgi:predicted dithiol-disulfide oxidoreductase (DUF899 family)